MFLEQLAHQPQRIAFVPPALNQHIEDLSLAVHGPLQIHPPAGDPNHHLVEVPSVTRPRAALPQRAGERILRSGAHALLTQAVEAEVADCVAKHADPKTETGHQGVVRHGHLREREIVTGIGPVAVRQPRMRDRDAAEGKRIRYSPSILPRHGPRSMRADGSAIRRPSADVYCWAGGIHLEARLEDQAQCILVIIIGATPEGNRGAIGCSI